MFMDVVSSLKIWRASPNPLHGFGVMPLPTDDGRRVGNA